MNYKKKDIIIGFVLLVLVIFGVYFYKNLKTPKSLPTPTPSTTKSDIQGLFDYVIPEDLDSVELKDVSGGDGKGIATRKFEDGVFSHTVLADLPDLTTNEFYEGWLVVDEKVISTGKMRIAKGGFLLEFSSKTDYIGYNKIVITKEKINDAKPEIHILEGSF